MTPVRSILKRVKSLGYIVTWRADGKSLWLMAEPDAEWNPYTGEPMRTRHAVRIERSAKEAERLAAAKQLAAQCGLKE